MGADYVYSNYHRQFMNGLTIKYKDYFHNKRLVDSYTSKTLFREVSDDAGKYINDYNTVIFAYPR